MSITASRLIIPVLFIIAGTMGARAQSYSNAISGDVVSLSGDVLHVTYEHRTAAANSFTVFGSFFTYSDWDAMGLGASYRWYIDIKDGKRALQGLSVGPFAMIDFWNWRGSKAHYDGGTRLAIGGELAYKWVFGGFAVEPILRLAINANEVNGISHRAFGIGVNLGYAW